MALSSVVSKLNVDDRKKLHCAAKACDSVLS